jgi:hypothetical protein
MPDMYIYEQDKGFVISKLKEGEFDYIDTGDEVFEADFFKYIHATKFLKALAETYPSPRKKHEIPIWFYLGSILSMRLHGASAFNQYSYIVRCGGMMDAFGPEIGKKSMDKETGDVVLTCSGFNNKNETPRETPCDQDYLRKLSKDTEPLNLINWYNQEVAKIWKLHKCFDKEGIFIGDASYLFVPDNPRYENSCRLLFDKHNHPVDPQKVEAKEIKLGNYKWKRCYKLVWLIHVDRKGEYFLPVALKVVTGKDHECPILYSILEDFLKAVGKGVIKLLILDRGFLDGERMGYFKKEYGIDTLIPVKKKMDIYGDAMGLLQTAEFSDYEDPKEGTKPEQKLEKSERIARREQKRLQTIQAKKKKPEPEKQVVKKQVASISDFTSYSQCPVPLTVIYCRDIFGDGHQEDWILLDTRQKVVPSGSRTEYGYRTRIEEQHRQLKCFSDLTSFTSVAFSLVVHHVLTLCLTLALVQIYLQRNDKKELNKKPMPMIRRALFPSVSYILIYTQDKVARLLPLEYTEILLTLEPEARAKALEKTRKLRREMKNCFDLKGKEQSNSS